MPAESGDVADNQPIDNAFTKMPYPVMVHHVLSLQPERHPLTVNGILDVMTVHGAKPESSDPRNTVKTALNRRRTKVGDVVHTGLGEWGLVSWYTDSELEKFKRGQDGANARDAKLHRENMKKGIAAAKARGAHYGMPPKFTEEMWNLAIWLFADEKRPLSYVHERVSALFEDGEKPMTKNSLQNRKKQFLAREPYPASWRAYFESRKQITEIKSEIENTAPKLKVVNESYKTNPD